MKVGCLENVLFSVSSDYVKTFRNLVLERSAAYASHARHAASSLTEFVGVNAGSISLDVELDEGLGIPDVMREVSVLDGYLDSGQTLRLVIGSERIGKYRWVLAGYKLNALDHDGGGRVIRAKATLNLTEYLRE